MNCEHKNKGLKGVKTRPHQTLCGDYVDVYCTWEIYCKDCETPLTTDYSLKELELLKSDLNRE